MNPLAARYARVLSILTGFAFSIFAQRISPAPSCAISPQIGTYPNPPLTYPQTSDRYAVQYSVNGGAFTDARVYISHYGGTNSSPFLNFSGYSTETSMSFVSIPVTPNASVQLRVTKLWDAPFLAADHVSVRPAVKGIPASLEAAGTVLISRTTGSSFEGEQFVLWWSRGVTGGAIESLAFFLDPPYTRPTGGNVKVVTASSDLNGDLSAFDTLDIEGVLAVPARAGMAPVPAGAVAFSVPVNITTIFLATGSWLQGKLRFLQSGQGQQRRVYGPGVLDVSRFEYDLRFCDTASPYPDQNLASISQVPVASGAKPDKFTIDGIVITDQNIYASDLLSNSTINNSKVLGWNGNNDGFELGINTVVSNVFIRSGDDSLKVWRSSVTITNATVWQNFNGCVVNVGWYKDSPGDSCLIDGLYVVKTDWLTPTSPSWNWTGLNSQNNAVFDSMMVAGTNFGANQPSVFRNIFIDDPPQVLFSLKIQPPRCSEGGLPAPCRPVNLQDSSTLNLQISNLYSPVPAVQSSIGFETLPVGYTMGGVAPAFPLPYTLTGTMNIGLNNIVLTPAGGTATALTSANAATLGKLAANGSNVNLTYTAGATPGVGGASPTSGSTAAQSFTLTFTDTAGFQNLTVVNALINNFLDGRRACFLAYSVPGSVLYLVDDGGDAGGPFAGSVAPGNPTVTIQNSQCAVNLVSATGSGNTLTLVLNIAFKAAFAGNKIQYLAAQDSSGGNTGWQAAGVWQVPPAPPGQITVTSLTPPRAVGASQSLTAAVTDTRGVSDLGVVNVLVNNFIDGRQACYVAYSTPGNTLYLVDDAGDAGGPFAGTMMLNGGSSTIQNSQCSISAAGSSADKSGDTLTLTLNLTFKSSGSRIVWVAGRDTADGNNTGWQSLGTVQ